MYDNKNPKASVPETPRLGSQRGNTCMHTSLSASVNLDCSITNNNNNNKKKKKKKNKNNNIIIIKF
jgi:hypothetical protein